MRIRMSTWVLCALGSASACAASCQTVAGYADFTPAHDAGAAPMCAKLGTRSKVGQHGSRLLLVDDPGTQCFWMDATEVTASDYRAWLATLAGTPPLWSGACAWKTTAPFDKVFDPDSRTDAQCSLPANELTTDPFAANKPIRCVDWCEANAYCLWAGKRLCHGYAQVTGLEPRQSPDEWSLACSLGGTKAWPFDTSAVSACNFGQAGCAEVGNACGPWPAGSVNSCRPGPGYPLDLGGNVSEWIDLCQNAHIPSDECHVRGGDYRSDISALACPAVAHARRASRDAGRGFRCCATLTQQELAQLGQ
jgi:sulfatase modifying factor 1